MYLLSTPATMPIARSASGVCILAPSPTAFFPKMSLRVSVAVAPQATGLSRMYISDN